MSQCPIQGCAKPFPLEIAADSVCSREPREQNSDFLNRLAVRISWSALRRAVEQLGLCYDVPEALPETVDEKLLHTLLLEHNITSGALFCEACKRAYPITDSVINMTLKDGEV